MLKEHLRLHTVYMEISHSLKPEGMLQIHETPGHLIKTTGNYFDG